MKCSYFDHNISIANNTAAPNAVNCNGPLYIFHDIRGCRIVCQNHAYWCKTLSCGYSHSKNCEHKNKTPFQQVTKL